jgi:hypothetical protein
MSYEIKCPSYSTTAKPNITSYDSGYEHSVEHWIEVRQMVEEEESEEHITVITETRELVLV